jgi:hypothetical protein
MRRQSVIVIVAIMAVGAFIIASAVAPNDNDRDVPGATTESGKTALDR